MKILTAIAALLVVASGVALAGGAPASPGPAWTERAPGAAQAGPERLIRASFPQPVAVTEVSTVLQFDEALVFIDPVGSQEQYRRFGRPDIVVLTRADPTHLNVDTMIGMLRRDTLVLAPQSVIDALPLMISNNVFTPFEAGTGQRVGDITFQALPASADVPRGAEAFPRMRGDIGLVIEAEGQRFYF